MCIRDSVPDGAGEHLQPVFLDTGNGFVTNLEDEGDDQRQDCLLYTSDAADERSSVDLGGRRIIKKKN